LGGLVTQRNRRAAAGNSPRAMGVTYNLCPWLVEKDVRKEWINSGSNGVVFFKAEGVLRKLLL
jgi:hypothetical protein